MLNEALVKKKTVPWLPTWASVEFSSGIFHFNAEWQGPIAGMDPAMSKAFQLQGAVHIRNCTLNGLDADHPVSTSLKRLFLFEVEQVRLLVFLFLSRHGCSVGRGALLC